MHQHQSLNSVMLIHRLGSDTPMPTLSPGQPVVLCDHITRQLSSFVPLFVFLRFWAFAGPTSIGMPPLAAARMALSLCLARSSPASAALTYQTLASRMSLLQPMPISVK